jgi:hypothetical protein
MMNSKRIPPAAFARPPDFGAAFGFSHFSHIRRIFADSRRLFCLALLLLCVAKEGFAQARHLGAAGPFSAAGTQVPRERANPHCQEWTSNACTACSIGSTIDISVKNKTKTPILLCRDMKRGPAKVLLVTHAEPAIPGLWEVEFGLGYQTAARAECPHQFVASNNPPLKAVYEVGPVTIEGEIPPDGMIQVLACVGLSSARVAGEGKETGASLKIIKLSVVSE